MIGNDIISQVEQVIKIQQDRNDMLKEISKEIGMDISFSDEALVKEISDMASKRIAKKIEEAVVQSMK
jgi:hypothetical protein